MKLLAFRFDIDTYLCMRDGLPNLVGLGNKVGARFTFFANMGKSVSRREVFRNMLGGNRPAEVSIGSCEKLSNIAKLGYWGYGYTALINPNLSRFARGNLRQASAAGHEVGLHGGTNHGSWLVHGASWSKRRIKKEVEFGLRQLQRYCSTKVRSFSSPGWQGSENLHQVLGELAFDVIADAHGHNMNVVSRVGESGGLRMVPTNILGEPGGVGYVEHLCASGLDESAALKRFQSDLEQVGDLAVVYDHPYFAGRSKLGFVEKMIRTAKESGYEIATISEVADKWEASNRI